MKFNRVIPFKSPALVSAVAVGSLTLGACGGGGDGGAQGGTATNGFADTALVSNNVGVVATTTTIDANLSNPWGLAMGPGLPFWVADNNSNVASLYGGQGSIETGTVTGSNTLGVALPASGAGAKNKSTGTVFNPGAGFLITTSKGQESALFVFDGEAGTLSAWAKDSGTAAVTVYDDGLTNGTDHAIYKGLAIGAVNGAPLLYATDLHNNKVDVFDEHFEKPADLQGKFVDPTMPAGFAPFGITALSGQLYVTYAMQDSAKVNPAPGAGLGYVDVFDFSGNFVSRFASTDSLNAPWGVALAPSGFGTFGGNVLVGNFGDGKINIFAPNGAALATTMGPLTVTNGGALSIPGLWAVAFGNGDPDKPTTTLFYTAGFANQTDGVFGSIGLSKGTAAPNPY